MNRKKRQIFASVIVIILVFAMILPMFAYILQYNGDKGKCQRREWKCSVNSNAKQFQERTMEDDYEIRKNIRGRIKTVCHKNSK